jgi:hypothetical protein
VTISKINSPTLPDKGAQYLAAFRTAIVPALQTMALDSLEASLAASQTVKPQGQAVRNEPPRVDRRYGPALLVPIDGKPVVKSMPDSRFERVINTQAMIARTRFGNTGTCMSMTAGCQPRHCRGRGRVRNQLRRV